MLGTHQDWNQIFQNTCGTWTGFRYSNPEKEQRDAAYLSYLLPSSPPCSTPLPMIPQRLTTTLEEIFHEKIPSHVEKHGANTVKDWKEMKRVHHISQEHRERERWLKKEFKQQLCYNIGNRRKFKRPIIHQNIQSKPGKVQELSKCVYCTVA